MPAVDRSQLAILAISAGILLLFAGLSIMTLLSVADEQTTSTSPSSANSNPVAVDKDVVQKIIELDFFGKPPPRARAAPPPVVVKPTRLQLKLLGVLNADADEPASIAIIAGPSGPEDAYRIKETLPGGATLEEVHPTHVVLKHNGRMERLDLEQQEARLGQPPR